MRDDRCGRVGGGVALEKERLQFLEEDFPRNGEGKASLGGREDRTAAEVLGLS